MPKKVIICPKCKATLPLAETLVQQIKDELRKDFDAAFKEKEKEFNKKEQEFAEKLKQLEDLIKAIEQKYDGKLKQEKENTEREVKSPREEEELTFLREHTAGEV